VDTIEIARVKRMVERHKNLDRIYTKLELAYIIGKGNRAETYAGIFAAKEAVVKALGTGFRGIEWKEIEIDHDQAGKPFARLTGKAELWMKDKGIKGVSISISHDQSRAIAFAVTWTEYDNEGDLIDGKCLENLGGN
jgi:holo-[acyl-carrier protein] synthase